MFNLKMSPSIYLKDLFHGYLHQLKSNFGILALNNRRSYLKRHLKNSVSLSNSRSDEGHTEEFGFMFT